MSDAYKNVVRKIAAEVLHNERKKRVIPADFLELFVAEVGGARALARALAAIVNDPKSSTVARARVMGDVLRLMQAVKRDTKSTNFEDVSTEDLEAMAADILREKADAEKGQDGPKQGAEAVRAEAGAAGTAAKVPADADHPAATAPTGAVGYDDGWSGETSDSGAAGGDAATGNDQPGHAGEPGPTPRRTRAKKSRSVEPVPPAPEPRPVPQVIDDCPPAPGVEPSGQDAASGD